MLTTFNVVSLFAVIYCWLYFFKNEMMPNSSLLEPVQIMPPMLSWLILRAGKYNETWFQRKYFKVKWSIQYKKLTRLNKPQLYRSKIIPICVDFIKYN
jgi:hypothetical protein